MWLWGGKGGDLGAQLYLHPPTFSLPPRSAPVPESVIADAFAATYFFFVFVLMSVHHCLASSAYHERSDDGGCGFGHYLRSICEMSNSGDDGFAQCVCLPAAKTIIIAGAGRNSCRPHGWVRGARAPGSNAPSLTAWWLVEPRARPGGSLVLP